MTDYVKEEMLVEKAEALLWSHLYQHCNWYCKRDRTLDCHRCPIAKRLVEMKRGGK